MLGAGWLLWSQPFHYGVRRYPTLGAKIHSVTIDRAGFPWATGPNGTFRFDGVRLVPAIEFGLPARSGDRVEVTNDGAVWVLSDGAVWRLEDGRFRKLSGSSRWTSISAAGDYLYAAGQHIAVWDKNAAIPVAESPSRGTIRGDAAGRVWFGAAGVAKWVRWNGAGIEKGVENLPADLWPEEVVPVGSDALAVVAQGRLHQLRRSGGQWISSLRAPPILANRTAIASRDGEALAYQCNQWQWLTNLAATVIPRPSTDSVGFGMDRRGGVWATEGLEEISLVPPNGRLRILYGFQSPQSPIHDVIRIGHQLLAATEQELIDLTGASPSPYTFCNGATVNTVVPRALPNAPPGGAYLAIVADPDGTFWAVQRHKDVVHLDRTGRLLARVPRNPDGGEPGQFVRNIWDLAHTSDGRLWAASKDNLIEIVKQPQLHYRFLSSTKRYFGKFVRDTRNQLYAITEGALLRYEAGNWLELPAPACLLSPRMRTVAISSSDEYWIGYRDQDGFTRTTRATPEQPWTCEHFGTRNGFANDTQFLVFDSQARLWRGSDSGLSFARNALRNPPTRIADWNPVSANLGIEPGEMGQVFREEADGSILTVVNSRLYQIPHQALAEDPGAPPQVSVLRRAQSVTLAESNRTLRWQKGESAVLELSALPEAALIAPAPIEYRFGDELWQAASQHAIPLAEVGGGERLLQLRYAGSAETLTVKTEVELQWWQTLSATVFLAVGVLICGWLAWPALLRQSYAWKKRRFFQAQQTRQRNLRVAPIARWTPGVLVRDRYRITRLLNQGGFADVYSADDESSGASVVIKQLRPPPTRSAQSESWLRRRFAQEVAAVALVRDAGVLPILDSWVDPAGLPHMVMRFVEGPTLREFLTVRAPVPQQEALAILDGMARTLAAAHSQGIVHCDLKPENVLLEPCAEGGYQPIVIDFGASVLHLQREDLSTTTHPAGSFLYMAPEQMLGRSSAASDVYSLAVIALEMLKNLRYADLELPMNDQWEQSLHEHFREAGIPAAAVFARALRYDPYQREADARVWLEALRTALERPRTDDPCP